MTDQDMRRQNAEIRRDAVERAWEGAKSNAEAIENLLDMMRKSRAIRWRSSVVHNFIESAGGEQHA